MSLSALRLLAVQRGLLPCRLKPTRIRLGHHLADLYQPVGPRRGTALTLHGMSPLGERDPRQIRFNQALATVGFEVISPRLPSIARLQMHTDQIDELTDLIDAAVERTRTPHLHLSSVSFTAGLMLAAAPQVRRPERIGPTLAVGAFVDIHTTTDALLGHPDATGYAWKIIFANLLRDRHRDLSLMLHQAAMDEWHQRTEPRWSRLLALLPPEYANRVTALLASPEARQRMWQRLRSDGHPTLTHGDLTTRIGRQPGPVTLLHGRHDPVIPAEQSQRIHETLTTHGRPAHLMVTDLLGHGDTKVRLRDLRQAPGVLRALDGWMEGEPLRVVEAPKAAPAVQAA